MRQQPSPLGLNGESWCGCRMDFLRTLQSQIPICDRTAKFWDGAAVAMSNRQESGKDRSRTQAQEPRTGAGSDLPLKFAPAPDLCLLLLISVSCSFKSRFPPPL